MAMKTLTLSKVSPLNGAPTPVPEARGMGGGGWARPIPELGLGERVRIAVNTATVWWVPFLTAGERTCPTVNMSVFRGL